MRIFRATVANSLIWAAYFQNFGTKTGKSYREVLSSNRHHLHTEFRARKWRPSLVKGIFGAGESPPAHIIGKFLRRIRYLLAQVAISLG